MPDNERLPLMLDKTVALATLVYPSDAFTVQFAMNQSRQKAKAR